MKLPPQALDAEMTVLGSLLVESKTIHQVITVLSAGDFYKTEHGLIYEAITSLFQENSAIDLLTVTSKLRSMGKLETVGGAFFVTQLTNQITSTANIEYHASIVKQKSIARKIIELGSTIVKRGYDETEDIFDLLNDTQSGVMDLSSGISRSRRRSIAEIVIETGRIVNEAAKNDTHTSGLSTGIRVLDEMTGGLGDQEVIVIAARPGMGKTSLALSIARNVAMKNKIPVGIFSMEMSDIELSIALHSMHSGIENTQIKSGQMRGEEWNLFNDAQTAISNSPIYIDDAPALTIMELRSKALAIKAESDMKLLIVDYMQLMKGSSKDNREREISQISQSIKALAKELKIPIIAISQLSRQVEQRGGAKRPILSDLRESGSIEQDADKVIFVYRPEYYGFDIDDSGVSTRGAAELIIAKNRGGRTDTALCYFEARTTNFRDREAMKPLIPNWHDKESVPY